MKMRGKRSVYVGAAMVVLMLIFLAYPMDVLGEGTMTPLNDDKKPKIIYVIYDNSTSMVRDDPVPPQSTRRYTTRWVEASYAIKALATMMNDQDILRIYPISGEGRSAEINFRNNSLNNVLEKIDGEISSLKWQTGTNFSSVEKAVEDLRNNYDSRYEHWVVILTDGAFGDLEGVPLQDKLEDFNLSDGAKGKPIYFAYIYISGGAGSETDEVRERRPYILIPDTADDEITGKMTNIANKIYNRVSIKSPEDYIDTEGADIRINLDIPLERALVFIQHTGEENSYNAIRDEIESTYRDMYLDGGIECSDGLKKDSMHPITGDSRNITKDSFNAARGDGTNLEEIVYRFIKGNMYVVVPTGLKNDFKKQYITVKNYTNNGDAYGDSIDVYYKPSVKVGASYFSEGQEIIHTQECMEEKSDGATEKCIPAGELVIQIDILANDETNEKITDYELLYPDDFEVSLYRKTGEEVALEKINSRELQYSCNVEKGEYELQVITSWNATYVQKLEIQDRWQPVAMEFYNTDSIYLESLENPSCEVLIRAFSGGEATNEEVLAHVQDIDLNTDNELFEVEKVGRQGNDIWRFRVTLKDSSVHDVGERLTLRAVAVTDYMAAQSNEHVFEDVLPITSGDFTISAAGQAEAADCFRRLFRGETIGIDYICDGIELTEEQRKGIEISDGYIVDPEKMQKKIRITNNGNIRLEYAPLYWFFHREDTVVLEWNVVYTRWNTRKVQTVRVELNIAYLPMLVQCLTLFTTLFIFAWVLLCFIKRFTHSFIEKERVILVSNYGSQRIRLCRKGMLWIPLWQKARIKYKDSSNYFPEIKLDIRNNPEGVGFEILNYDILGDETKYRLGNGRISENNCIISDSKQVQVADRNGIWYKMKMER